ncbi:MAG: hypothetical protein RRA94_10535 [Bacteroidota bacterium]|nr:hypothetical protein [Bacteroidota bacterium]
MSLTPPQIRRIWFWSILASVAYLVLHIVEDRSGALHVSTWLFAALIMLFSLWAGWKNRSVLLAVIGVTAGLLAWHYEAAMHCDTVFTRQSWTVHLIAFGVLLAFSLPATLLQRKRTRTWNRWIFVRAAENAAGNSGGELKTGEPETGGPKSCEPETDAPNAGAANAGAANGFTALPCHVRTAEYDVDELRSFARFLGDRRIAVPHWNGETLDLFLPGEDALYKMRGFDTAGTTRVSFDPEGAITAHVSRRDYLPFHDRIPYTALCRGLGDVLYDFLQRQRHGEQDLVLREVHDDTRQAETVLIIIGMLVYLFAVLLYFGLL